MSQRSRVTRPALFLAASVLLTSTSALATGSDLVSRRSRGIPSNLAALLFAGRDGGNLAAFATVLPLPSDGGPSTVPFVIEVDGASLLAAEADTVTLGFYGYAVDHDRQVRAHFSQQLSVGIEDVETAPIGGGLRYAGRLELPAGSFLLRFLVQEPASGRYALRSVNVEIPPPPDARTSVPMAMRFVADESEWLTAREAREAGVERDLLDELPTALPAALPVLVPGEEQSLDLIFHGALPRDEPMKLAFLDAKGKRVGNTDLRRSSGPSTPRKRLHVLPTSFTVPALEEGSYGLELQAASTERREQPLQVAVFVVEDPRAGAGAWTHWIVAGGNGRGSSPAGGSRPGRGDRAVGAVALAYREALSSLAMGQDAESIRQVGALEAEAVGEGDEKSLRSLVRGEWQVAATLADRDPEVLPPLLSLHLRLGDLYRRERNFVLASHSRRLAVTLATEYAERAATPEARSVASQTLTVLGNDLHELQLWAAAQRLLERALELDAGNPSAILSLALGSEKRGLYREAAQFLERLVELDPKSAEGRLRLAINLRRVGERDRAEELLARLIGESNPSWILTLAYQELGRMALTDGRGDDSVRLFEDGVARLPRQSRLHLLRAYALDRAGAGGATQVIDRLARMKRHDGPSARFRYNQRARDDREEIRRLLDRNSILRLTALADALAGTEESERG